MAFPARFIVVALVLLLAPLGVAQQDGVDERIQNPHAPTPVTLYMHIDGLQDFPINTQAPDDRFLGDQAYGLATNSLSCVADPGPAGVGRGHHTHYGYSSPGYVEYDFEEDGKPRYHRERGIAYDVELDTDAPMTLHWYLETQATGIHSDANQAPVVVPDVVVQATMRSGDAVGLGANAFDDGHVIAQGRTAPVTLAAEHTRQDGQVTYQNIDGRHVYGFAVPMGFQDDQIDRDEAFNVRIDVFMDNPLCNDPVEGYLMANHVRVHTSPDHRPRMELSIMNPVRVESIRPHFTAEGLVVNASMSSPWGNYDVDEGPGGIGLAIVGPSDAAGLFRADFVQRIHEYGHHHEPVAASWVWPYAEDGAEDGIYAVRLSVWNHQRTAQAVAEAQFQIGTAGMPACDTDDPAEGCLPTGASADRQSPGVGVVAVVGLLALLALAAGRRRGGSPGRSGPARRPPATA